MADQKLEDLNLGSEFKYVIQVLQNQLKTLDNECAKQVLNGNVSEKELRENLDNIDKFIMNNKAIKNAIIEGKEDVKKIIDAVNLEIKDRMESFKGNFSETDENIVDKVERETASRNKRQEEVDKFDTMKISSKDLGTRAYEAENEANDLKDRINNVEKLDKILDEMLKNGTVKDKNSAKDMLISQFQEAQKLEKKVEESLDKKASIKQPNEYSNKFEKNRDFLQRKVSRDEKLTEKEEKDIIDFIYALSDLDKKEFRELKNCIIVNVDSSGNKKKEIRDFKDLYSKLKDNRYDNIDWDEKVNTAKENYDNEARTMLSEILEKDIFKRMYPSEFKAYKIALERPYETDIIKNEMSQALFSENLEKKLNKTYNDLLNKDNLKTEVKSATLRSKNLNDFINKQKTTTVKLKKFDNTELQLEENGQKVDFSKIIDEDKESFIEKLYNQFKPTLSDDKRNEMNDRYEQDSINGNLPVKYRKPNIFRRAWYKLTHPSTWGSGQGLADEVKSAWLENEIKEDIKSGIDKIKADSQFMLTPEQEEDYNKKMKELEAAQRKKALEKIVNTNSTAKNAHKNAQNEFNKEQKDVDEDMQI